jgi:hypothetical protein
MLASVAPKIGDPELKRMASKAIRAVRKQEQAHVNWSEQTPSLHWRSRRRRKRVRPAKKQSRGNSKPICNPEDVRGDHKATRRSATDTKKATAAAKKKRTIAHLSSDVRTALGKKARPQHERSVLDDAALIYPESFD